MKEKTIIVHRFMSEEEYDLLVSGFVLTNHSDHPCERTTSVGFCFTPDDPSVAIKWLGGLVETDYCVTFEVREDQLSKSVAEYRDVSVPLPDMCKGFIPTETKKIRRVEYCTEFYSIRDFHIVSVSDSFRSVAGAKRIQKILEGMGYRKQLVDKSGLR